jgi:hypothetical protein
MLFLRHCYHAGVFVKNHETRAGRALVNCPYVPSHLSGPLHELVEISTVTQHRFSSMLPDINDLPTDSDAPSLNRTMLCDFFVLRI